MVEESNTQGKKIGKVIHYFDKIKVAVLLLDSPLKVGDEIRIEGGEVDFNQVIKSMQVDHKEVKTAKAGSEVGVQVDEKVRDGYRIYKT